ncbi:protein TASOR 2-like isoform 1-T1 [Symphorus nematophorus]
MAVKPSKSDEIQAERISKDRQIESSVMSNYSQNKKTEIPFFTYATLASMILEKKAESLRGSSAGRNNYTQEASELSSKNSCSSNVSDSKSNSDKARFALLDPLHQYEGRDISKFNRIPSSSLPMQSFEYAKISSPLVDGNQSSLTNTLVGKAGLTANKNTEMDQKDCSGTSTLVVDYREDSIADDNLFLGPQSTLTCTVYNTSQKRPDSFLDQVSQRCLQDDPTQASMEQECLIFSEQMKQLLKRSKREPSHQLDMHDGLNLCGSSPVTVHFSSLEEDEDSVDHFDAPSLVGQKIKVDMSDRKDLAEVKEEGKTLHSQRVSQGTGNPMEHAGVSRVTAECARLYRAMMNDICSVRKVSSRSDHLRMDRVYPKTEPSNHFDFCDQMKKEVDESFRSNLNSVVKKSCKTKYRFYILVTSDDAFFEETKAQLEAEGHTAVQPSEFFLGEDSSSSLLIILRNEDIAEHICEVPHLLELKKSPGVQFAGIDEPDDVVNLTHQELFMRGGFIMFDKAALESLTLCNMKKLAEILQELCRTGKWKWMMHYKDSRRLKENARLSPEAKEKKHFLNWCQEVGILEVLPYHECDVMSRDQPDYLACLVRLQVQNISARYPVFITDTTTDSTFGTNGILTMTSSAILTCPPSETFTV